MFLCRENENDFSFWFPKVKDCGIPVPKTFYTKLPAHEDYPEKAERLYRAFYMESPKEDLAFIEAWIEEDIAPKLKEAGLTGHIFVKNARFSNKFNANGSCNIYGLLDLPRAIANINYEAMCVDADGVDEIVVREFIEYDRANTPCIYNGLPFRPEFRVFYDFDSKEVIFTANYWDFDYVFPHLYNATDRIIFAHERMYMEKRFLLNEKRVEAVVRTAMKRVDGLSGQWSIDLLMDEKENLWLIDMAIAQRSAYWELRPDKDRYK